MSYLKGKHSVLQPVSFFALTGSAQLRVAIADARAVFESDQSPARLDYLMAVLDSLLAQTGIAVAPALSTIISNQVLAIDISQLDTRLFVGF